MKIYDSDIRALLIEKIKNTKEFSSDPTTIMIHEMDICCGGARIDIAVINGKFHGFEIKSEQDNLERLPSQKECYNKVFDTITLVTTERHYLRAIELVPDWWGIYCVTYVSNRLTLKTMRKPKSNKQMNVFYLTQNLWRNELVEILNVNGITKGLKSKTRFELSKMLVENVDEKQIKDFIKEKFKSRESWRAVQLQQLCGG